MRQTLIEKMEVSDTDTIKQEDSYTKLTKVRKDNFR